MSNRFGKISSLLFICVTLLPLIGLLMMDYQVKRANDITGSYILSGDSAYKSDGLVGSLMVFCLIVMIVATFAVGKIHQNKFISTMPLSKIDQEIKKIDEHLNNYKR